MLRMVMRLMSSELLAPNQNLIQLLDCAAPFSNIEPHLCFQQPCAPGYCLTALAQIIKMSYVLSWNPIVLLTHGGNVALTSLVLLFRLCFCVVCLLFSKIIQVSWDIMVVYY